MNIDKNTPLDARVLNELERIGYLPASQSRRIDLAFNYLNKEPSTRPIGPYVRAFYDMHPALREYHATVKEGRPNRKDERRGILQYAWASRLA